MKMNIDYINIEYRRISFYLININMQFFAAVSY